MPDVCITLPRPHAHQQKILDSNAKIKVLKCGRQSGKSTIAKVSAIKAMLKGGKVLYICHDYGLSKKFYAQLLEVLPAELIESNNASTLSIKLKGLGNIEFYSGHATLAMRGTDNVALMICDEFAFWRDPENSYYNDIQPTLARSNGDTIILSSPFGRNFFWQLWIEASQCTNGEMEAFYFTILDNPFISQEFIERTQRTVPANTWLQEYLALETASEDCIVEADVITRNTIDELATGECVVIGIDLAKSHDYTSITGLNKQGEMVLHHRFQKDWNSTIDFITTLPAHVLKVIDSTGVGDVVFDQLCSKGVQNLVGFKFNSQSKPELIKELILALERNELKFTKTTADELGNYRFHYSSKSGYIKYEGLPFDDTVISLALSNKYRKQVIYNNNFANSFAVF
ncbi:hypothetical protein OQZ33_07030 [Pedobacter sp. MC2016-05]|uniref:terminase large subunit domain-containing protein n=1 Tax=Pedobacter sp. MC2016-05 TaxID=2994474 RepID=UPI002247C167|nr:terminase family protein [Pedobacter sp. MC2016-05]MCX2474078.1 hypothetical protein [Pedobacter sp. MC2016-05]